MTTNDVNLNALDLEALHLDALHLEAWLDALAPVSALPIAAAYRPGVLINLKIAVRFAALINNFSLPDESELAPVFKA